MYCQIDSLITDLLLCASAEGAPSPIWAALPPRPLCNRVFVAFPEPMYRVPGFMNNKPSVLLLSLQGSCCDPLGAIWRLPTTGLLFHNVLHLGL